ncbi:MAG: type II toxin-antitoxin system RelE/ParE family toxin [Acidobacteria bacterium]|nr:type II toxin-antitoxin system RelE/ParE family toxin [Acidobacteriota bacterium]
MFEIVQSATFSRWFQRLRDRQAGARILARLRNVSLGNLGETRSVGDGVSEVRLHCGPGYRLYFLHRGKTVVVLLCGGDKDSQDRDIEHAKRIARDWR